MRTLGQSLICLATISVGMGLLTAKPPPAAPASPTPAAPAPAAAPAKTPAAAPAKTPAAAPAASGGESYIAASGQYVAEAPIVDPERSQYLQAIPAPMNRHQQHHQHHQHQSKAVVVPIDQKLDSGLIEYHQNSEAFKNFKPTFHGQ